MVDIRTPKEEGISANVWLLVRRDVYHFDDFAYCLEMYEVRSTPYSILPRPL